ncbi:MAG: hypothetical protein JXA92_00735 [candidate division Zixibacteria bacterium]|nr:hypothetical protein [candidate division Zixibacteria bacterium]
MFFGAKSLNALWFIIVLFLTALVSTPVRAQSPELIVSISDTTGYPGEEVFLPVYIANFNDTIAGFIMVLTLSNEVASFQPSIITEGTLIAGWEYIDVRLVADAPRDLQITALADAYFPPIHTPGFPPQASQKLLLKLLLKVAGLHDTVTVRTIDIDIIPDISKTNFSTSDFRVVGLVTDTTYDTLWFDCASWFFDSCVTWVQIPGPPADYMYVDSNIHAWLDTNAVIFDDGSLTALIPVCGDLTGEEVIDISDITRLIGFLYLQGEPPVCLLAADVNNSPDGTIDISDITRLIQNLYINGTPLRCSFNSYEK